MPRASSARWFPLVVLGLLLVGCGEVQDWRSAQRADTLEAYEAFLERYPQGQYSSVARRRAADLLEQRDWLIASEADTAQAYRRFIDTHPKGRWTREARLRLQSFLSTPGTLGPAAIEPLEVVPAEVPPMEVAPTGVAPVEVVPGASTPPTSTSPTIPAALEHRIQLGAFTSPELAGAAWREARDRHAELQGLVSQLARIERNGVQVYRLQAGVASEAQARQICRVLSEAGQACVYVPPVR